MLKKKGIKILIISIIIFSMVGISSIFAIKYNSSEYLISDLVCINGFYKIGNTVIPEIYSTYKTEDDIENNLHIKKDNNFYTLDPYKKFDNYGYVIASSNLSNKLDAKVQDLYLSADYNTNNQKWKDNHKALSWLLENLYLSTNLPEQKDEFLSKAFSDYDIDINEVKKYLYDEEIDCIQQYAIWHFTNGDNSEFSSDTLPTYYYVKGGSAWLSSETNLTFNLNRTSDLPYISVDARTQELANHLYQYLINSAKNFEKSQFPTLENTNLTRTINSDYYIIGPFKVNSGTEIPEGFDISLINYEDIENQTVVNKENYKVAINGEFTDKNLNEIFDQEYYIYLNKSNNLHIPLAYLRLSYNGTSYQTKATLYNGRRDEKAYQPIILVQREDKENVFTSNIINVTAETTSGKPYYTFKTILDSANNEIRNNEEFEITAKIEQIRTNLNTGLLAISGQLGYDKNVLELIDVQAQNTWSIENGWNEETLKFAIDSSSSILEDGEILKFKFKAKDGIQSNTKTSIKLNNIVGSDTWEDINSQDVSMDINIIENEKAEISSEKYNIENDNNFISKILPKTTLKEFLANIESNKEITVTDKDGNIVAKDSLVATGMTLKIGEDIIYTLVVTGDIDGNGEIGITDLAKMKLHLIEKNTLVGAYCKAADVNYDTELSITDLAKIKLVLIEKEVIE